MHDTETKLTALLRLAIDIDQPDLRLKVTQGAIELHRCWRDVAQGIVTRSSAAVAEAANGLDDVAASLYVRDDEGDENAD
jgi:hypothetical protein